MSTLTITPFLARKTAKCSGVVAGGEQVDVTIVNAAGIETRGLRLRMLFDDRTFAKYPLYDSDAWTVDGSSIRFVLNLETAPVLELFRSRLPACLFGFVLDNVETGELYFDTRHEVKRWSRVVGRDEPVDLHHYRDDMVTILLNLSDTSSALQGKVESEPGKGLSTLDVTPEMMAAKADAADVYTKREADKAVSGAVAAVEEKVDKHAGDAGIHVSEEERSALNGRLDAVSDAASAVGEQFDAHARNAGIHVTDEERSTLNGRLDAAADTAEQALDTANAAIPAPEGAANGDFLVFKDDQWKPGRGMVNIPDSDWVPVMAIEASQFEGGRRYRINSDTTTWLSLTPAELPEMTGVYLQEVWNEGSADVPVGISSVYSYARFDAKAGGVTTARILLSPLDSSPNRYSIGVLDVTFREGNPIKTVSYSEGLFELASRISAVEESQAVNDQGFRLDIASDGGFDSSLGNSGGALKFVTAKGRVVSIDEIYQSNGTLNGHIDPVLAVIVDSEGLGLFAWDYDSIVLETGGRRTVLVQSRRFVYGGMEEILLGDDAHIYIAGYVECLAPGTKIRMAGGSELPVERLAVGMKVESLNPRTMTVEADEVVYTDARTKRYGQRRTRYGFEDGTAVDIVQDHSLWNHDRTAMVHMSEWAIGEHARTADGKLVALASKDAEDGDFLHYTLFTKRWNNYFANGLLAGNRRSSGLYFNADGTPARAPRMFSKFRCVEMLMREGLWDSVRAWIERSGLYDLYLASNEFAEDNPHFMQGLATLKSMLGIDDAKVEEILAASAVETKED